MFVFPQIISLPALSGIVAGSFEWPALGAVIVWLLMAVLLTALVGVIAEHAVHAPERESKGSTAYIRPLHIGHARRGAA
jgi:hypothetical protein